MDGNRLQSMIALLFIYLSVSLSLTTGKPLKASNRTTGGYTPVLQQSLRTITVGRNAMHAFNDFNNNNFNHFNNISKANAKTEMNSDSHSDSEAAESESHEWSLQFDPNYFASLNAANHRPIDSIDASPSDNKSKVSASSSSSSTSSGDNMYYYSPETYGKTSHKNHKTGSFAYAYPGSSNTVPTTTSTTTTPTPKTSNNRFGEVPGTTGKGFSEPAPQVFSTPYNSNQKQTTGYNYDASDEEEQEDTNYYDGNEEVGRKYYYPMRNRPKQYSLRDNYGSDLSSMSTSNENLKIKSAVNTPVASYGTQEEAQDYGSNIEAHYESGQSNVPFPPKFYGGSGSTSSYYPSYYPSALYGQHSAEHSSYSGGDSLMHKSSSWLGPGIAGLLLGIGLPLGILMASIVPAFLSVPIVSTATVGRKKRQISAFDILGFNTTNIFLNPGVFKVVARYGMPSLEDSNCLKEMFCTFSAEGRDDNSNLAQNILFNLINWTPDQWTKSVGLDTLFNAIKKNKCQNTYQCMSRKVKFKDTEKYNK